MKNIRLFFNLDFKDGILKNAIKNCIKIYRYKFFFFSGFSNNYAALIFKTNNSFLNTDLDRRATRYLLIFPNYRTQ